MNRTTDYFDESSEGVSTLRHYVLALWRRRWLFLAPVLVLPALALLTSAFQPAVFEASADVLVDPQSSATTSLIGQTPPAEDRGHSMWTQVQLVGAPQLLDRTIAASGVSGVSPLKLRRSSEVFALSDVLRFVVSHESPAAAASLATAYAREYVAYRRELDTAGLARALEQLRTQMEGLERDAREDSPLYVRLADREAQLEALEALRSSNVTVVATAEEGDAEQVAPRPLRNTALAFAAGVVLGLVLVALWETISTKPRSREEMERALGMTFLGRLGSGPAREGASGADGTLAGIDAAHAVRVRLDLARGLGAGGTLVTSLDEGPARSTAAATLALAYARAGSRVVLVDLDLRSRQLTRMLELDGRIGVATLADGRCSVEDALVEIPLEDAVDHGSLEVVPADAPSRPPVELVGSRALAEGLDALEQRADVVLVDVPPLLETPDAAVLSRIVAGLLLAVDARGARVPALSDGRRLLEALPIAKHGFVIVAAGGSLIVGGGRAGAVRPARGLAEPGVLR